MSNQSQMTVGIVGLGLIGGSMARAFAAAGYRVLAVDKSDLTMTAARQEGVVADTLTPENAAECALLLLAVYPAAAIEAFRMLAPHLSPAVLVMDLCGTKRQVTEACFAIAAEHGIDYVGGHPMAGTQFSGFQNSKADLFVGAPMVLVLPEKRHSILKEKAISLLSPAGFASFSDTTAEIHDRVIAFTSQLAHVVSNAYVKSPQAQIHHGFSAGSYRDLTRVAWLNETMWCELFLENRDYLSEEIGIIINALAAYKKSLDENDPATLTALLRDGRIAKERADQESEISWKPLP